VNIESWVKVGFSWIFCTKIKSNSPAGLDPEERGALGVLERESYIKTQSQTEMEDSSHPNGISAAGLTNQGKRALAGPRW
jgi:hypothetical protein